MQGTECKWTPGAYQIAPGSLACLHGCLSTKIQLLITLISISFGSSPKMQCAPFCRMFLMCWSAEQAQEKSI